PYRARMAALDAVLDVDANARESAHALLADADVRLVFGWRPTAGAGWAERARAALRARGVEVHVACCPHPEGPPRCSCRPPLPGLVLAFAQLHGVNLARSLLIGTGPAHASLARAVGAAYEQVEPSQPLRVSS